MSNYAFIEHLDNSPSPSPYSHSPSPSPYSHSPSPSPYSHSPSPSRTQSISDATLLKNTQSYTPSYTPSYTNTPAESAAVKLILSSLSTTLTGKSTSEQITVSQDDENKFNSYYSAISDEFKPELPLVVTTTTLNKTTGNQAIDTSDLISNLSTTTNVLVPLDSGRTIDLIVGNKTTTITRNNSNQISINGGPYLNFGDTFVLDGTLFIYTAAGSPIVLQVVNPNSNKPSSVLDYIFMYSYMFAFVGAIFYAISSVVNIDPSTILVNKSMSVVLNAFIGLSGFVALCAWLNTTIIFLEPKFMNRKVIKQNN